MVRIPVFRKEFVTAIVVLPKAPIDLMGLFIRDHIRKYPTQILNLLSE